MDRIAIMTAILLFSIVADVSNASSFSKLRFLADKSPPKNDTTAATPPSSQLLAKKLDPKPNSQSKSDPNITHTATQSPVDKKDQKLSDKPGKVIPPPQREIDSEKNSSSTSNSTNFKTVGDNEGKKKNIDSGKKPNITETEQGAVVSKEDNNKKQQQKTDDDGNETQSGIVETCDGVANSCKDRNSLTACIKGSETGSKRLAVLVHNSGEKTLKVNVAGLPGESFAKILKVPKRGTRKINISLTISETSELKLSAGNGDCVLHMNPLVPEGNFFLNLPSYDKLLTPVNGAYFLIATIVILGGSWACCMFRKGRRHDGGIPYQELEMGLPESMQATEVETAEGWDQGWDSDWDEDKAVKSPMGRRQVPNISANGLTARSSNRDGWENNWDD
ncbi:hypothetical protein ES319_D10G126100v1 [Gossypium barbadense]|uniref:DUF7356 domain-containing protein n=2 Tax=Gossypium TaxID=3633 RepID=A0A5J5PQD1_GOSBA|nr:hypothetical protein ES319_D10G126100v1 [Gossypium barbadense]PPE02591.1 hypothetical protein GOBAR_DD00416 [Gossypium barbadense]TYG49935.1 hypothetical protein ES288_D10G134500v1 [Gossypium darwinii]